MSYFSAPSSSSSFINNVYHVVVDTETTGVLPRKGTEGSYPRIVQLAILIPQLGLMFEEKINPEMAIPKAASAVHHIYDSDVEHARTFNAVWLDALNFISTSLNLQQGDTVIYVGHNFRFFDRKVIKKECKRVGLNPIPTKDCDTLVLTRKLFEGLVKERTVGFFKLQSLAPLAGLEDDHAHDAAGDVRVNSKLFDHYISGIDTQKVHSAMLEEDPEVQLTKLILSEGSFKPSKAYKAYKNAGKISIILVRRYLSELSNSCFFEPKNLAALLDLSIRDCDRRAYICWKIFLEMTKGIERKKVIEALSSIDPLESISDLMPLSFRNLLMEKIHKCDQIVHITLPLGEMFFASHSIPIPDWSALAKNLGVRLSGKYINPAEGKRLFLKLTRGLEQSDVDSALVKPDAIDQLLKLIIENGALATILPQQPSAKRPALPLKLAMKMKKIQRLN